jgi:hypothetical protein
MLASHSDLRSQINSNNSRNKDKMTSSSLAQSREALVSTVGSVIVGSKGLSQNQVGVDSS